MGRPVVRLLMAVVGFVTIGVYAALAYLGYRVVAAVVALRPSPVALVVGVGVAALVVGYASYRVGTRRLLAGLDAAPLSRDRAPGMYDRLDRLCELMGVPPPTVYVARFDRPNALAVGGARGGTVVVDRTLFRVLSAAEFEALLAHELAHLASYDALVVTVADAAVRTVAGLLLVVALPPVVLLRGLSRGVAWLSGRPLRPADTVFDAARRLVERAVVATLLLLTLPLFALSRRREFAADRRAAAATDPLALARALRALERASMPDWGLWSLLYTRGDEVGGRSKLFSTHPDTDERVRRLVELADGSPEAADRPGAPGRRPADRIRRR